MEIKLWFLKQNKETTPALSPFFPLTPDDHQILNQITVILVFLQFRTSSLLSLSTQIRAPVYKLRTRTEITTYQYCEQVFLAGEILGLETFESEIPFDALA